LRDCDREECELWRDKGSPVLEGRDFNEPCKEGIFVVVGLVAMCPPVPPTPPPLIRVVDIGSWDLLARGEEMDGGFVSDDGAFVA
jgi:hypothetical protein